MEPGRGETLNGSLVKLWGNAVVALSNLTEPLFWEVYEVLCVTTGVDTGVCGPCTTPYTEYYKV